MECRLFASLRTETYPDPTYPTKCQEVVVLSLEHMRHMFLALLFRLWTAMVQDGDFHQKSCYFGPQAAWHYM